VILTTGALLGPAVKLEGWVGIGHDKSWQEFHPIGSTCHAETKQSFLPSLLMLAVPDDDTHYRKFAKDS